MPIFEFIMLKLLDRLFEPINICDGSIVALLDSMGWSENIQKNFASIYIYTVPKEYKSLFSQSLTELPLRNQIP